MNTMKMIAKFLWFVGFAMLLLGSLAILLKAPKQARNVQPSSSFVSQQRITNLIPTKTPAVSPSITPPMSFAIPEVTKRPEEGLEFKIYIETPERERITQMKKRLRNMELAKNAAAGQGPAVRLVQSNLRALQQELDEITETDFREDVEGVVEVDALILQIDRNKYIADIKTQLEDLNGKTLSCYDDLKKDVENLEKETIIYDKKTVEEYINKQMKELGYDKYKIKFSNDFDLTITIAGATDGEMIRIKSGLERHVNMKFCICPNDELASQKIYRLGYDICYDRFRMGYYVERKCALTGEYIASVKRDDSMKDDIRVILELNEAGEKIFHEITTNNVGKRLAILINGGIISAPIIHMPVDGKAFKIIAAFTKRQADYLVKALQLPHLPVRLRLIEVNQVTIGR